MGFGHVLGKLTMGLRSKVFIPVIIISLAFIAYLQSFWLPEVSRVVNDNYQQELKAHINSVAESLIPFLIEEQLANIHETLTTLKRKNKNWISVALYNEFGQRLYPLQAPPVLNGQNIKLIEQQVGFSGPYYGLLKVYIDTSVINQKIANIENTFRTAFFTMLIFLVANIFGVLQFVILRPLKYLINASNHLARGNYQAPIPTQSNDEIGQLTRSFEVMRKALKAYHQQLVGEINQHKQTAVALEEEKDRATYQATHDSLTGLINRREFEQRLRQAAEQAAKLMGNHALLYIDLDQFKVVNDTCGHTAGDALLQQLNIILNEQIRQQDTLARLGGDEFGVLLQYCSLNAAKVVAENLRKAIQEFHFVWQDKSFSIGASIGLVVINSESGDISNLLSSADSACYAAKANGRNQVQIFQQENTLLVRQQGEMLWVTRIVEAIEENRFELYCQPIQKITSTAEDIPHYEILLRLNEDDGKVISPGSFIPAAERYNLINTIDRWVVKNTFKFLATVDASLHVSINLSGASLGDRKLQNMIKEHMFTDEIKKHSVCFEITESAAIISLSSAKHFIETLKSHDCLFSLDDFGSGMSSFSYLKTLPVNYLKIDGAFVREIDKNPVDQAMVKSINEIGHTMGLTTIAEFVESESILDELKSIGVDYVQGYHISKPFPLRNLK